MSQWSEPQVGTKRWLRMDSVRHWLGEHPEGGTYPEMAQGTGLVISSVRRAVDDLHRSDPHVYAVPAPHNGYRASANLDWRAARGEANQLRHLATRLDTFALRNEKIATDPKLIAGLPVSARGLQLSVEQSRFVAHQMTQLAEMFEELFSEEQPTEVKAAV
jgi:hypothetical protein